MQIVGMEQVIKLMRNTSISNLNYTAGRTTVRVTGNEVLPDNPGPYKWKCCSLKLWVIACIAGVFIPVLVITAATVSVVLTHEETRSFQTQHLTSGGTTEYGISRGTVDFYVYQRIYLEESSDDITLVIGMTVSTTNMNETIDSSLASGPSINEEYCNSNFTYTATVTGNITSNVIFVVRRTDEQNKVTTVCNETITSSGKLLNCVSNDSGYYDASFNNPENVIGNVIGTVSCGIIDTKAYENESSKCTAADSGGSGCSVAVTQTHNQVILFLPSDIDSRMVTLRYKLRLWVFITSSVIFGLIVSILVAFVLIPLIHWTCRRRLSSSTSEVGDEREEQRERNSQPVGSPQEEVEV